MMRQLVAISLSFNLLLGSPAIHADDFGTSDNSAAPIPEKVSDVLQQHCFKCHSAESSAAGLDLSSWEAIQNGSDNGSVISRDGKGHRALLAVLNPDAQPHMPPNGQLDEEAISALQAWMDQLPDVVAPTKEPTLPDSNLLPSEIPARLAIDLYIQQGYAERSVVPASRSSDLAFVRRIYLDLIGRIPTPQETQQFLTQTDSAKRERLIDDLLLRPEHARHLARLFDTMLMGRREGKRGARRNRGWTEYLEQTFSQNRPWNEFAHEVLLGREGPENDAHRWYLYERENKHQEMAESIARGFFGIDIACAQCHDHPLAHEIKQAHYWGLVAFYKRTSNDQQDNRIYLKESAIGGFDDYANALKGTTESSMLTFFQADTIAEPRPDDPAKQEDKEEFYVSVDGRQIPKFSRREEFVTQVLDGHPLLARAMVNRIWGTLLGRGIVHPIEQMDSTKPASHPELLSWLSRDFESHGFDVRRLVRAIVTSETYQRSSIPATDTMPAAESFGVALVKPLPAESLLDSLSVALQTPVPLDSPVAREWRKLFPEVVPENDLSNLKQALALSNFPQLNELLQQADAQQPSIDAAQIQDWYWRVFGRPADEMEQQAVLNYAQGRSERPADARAQILWAMVTSSEFRFNH